MTYFAVGYLGEAHDRGSATQDELWAALDRYARPRRRDPDDRERSWSLRWLRRRWRAEGWPRRPPGATLPEGR